MIVAKTRTFRERKGAGGLLSASVIALACLSLSPGSRSWAQAGSAEKVPGSNPPGHATGIAQQMGAHAEHLVWRTDLPSSLEMARRANKLVLIDIYTDWCGWCKRLERDTYTDPAVSQVMKNQFVLVKLDAEDGGPGEAFAKKYKVNGFPCIMALEPSGKVRLVNYGYLKPPEFMEVLNKMLQPPSS